MESSGVKRGSVEVVALVLVVIALLGVLGWVVYQNIEKRERLSAQSSNDRVAQDDEKSDHATVTGVDDRYRLDLPADWRESDRHDKDEHGRAFATYSDSDDVSRLTVTVFAEGNFVRTDGMPSTVQTSTPIDEWYSEQGVEYPAAADGLLGADHGGYAYRVSRDRSQSLAATLYAVKDGVLYEISVPAGKDADITSVTDDGGATVEFSSEMKQILASFNIL